MRTNRILVSALLFLISSPSFSKVFDAQINMVNFPQEQEAKVHKAIELIKKVVLSPEFKDRVLSHTYEGKRLMLITKV